MLNSLPPAPQPRLTVYYDGACPVCSREIAMYRRQAGAEACAWVDATRCDAAALGADLPRPAALARFHVRRADGVLVSGIGGFALLWQALPRTARWGRIAAWGPMPAVLDAAYALFLKLRRLWLPLPRASTQTAASVVGEHAATSTRHARPGTPASRKTSDVD